MNASATRVLATSSNGLPTNKGKNLRRMGGQRCKELRGVSSIWRNDSFEVSTSPRTCRPSGPQGKSLERDSPPPWPRSVAAGLTGQVQGRTGMRRTGLSAHPIGHLHLRDHREPVVNPAAVPGGPCRTAHEYCETNRLRPENICAWGCRMPMEHLHDQDSAIRPHGRRLPTRAFSRHGPFKLAVETIHACLKRGGRVGVFFFGPRFRWTSDWEFPG